MKAVHCNLLFGNASTARSLTSSMIVALGIYGFPARMANTWIARECYGTRSCSGQETRCTVGTDWNREIARHRDFLWYAAPVSQVRPPAKLGCHCRSFRLERKHQLCEGGGCLGYFRSSSELTTNSCAGNGTNCGVYKPSSSRWLCPTKPAR